MRRISTRFSTLLLALLALLANSGALAAVHRAGHLAEHQAIAVVNQSAGTHAADDVDHDEHSCTVCATLHASFSADLSAPVRLAHSLVAERTDHCVPWMNGVHSPLSIDCRGPPRL